MKHKCINKISFSILIFLLSVMFMKGGAMAATFNDINADNMFFKQNTSTTCTLSSAAMLVRRAALLNGNANWSTVTEANMRSTAWLSGTGLYNSFSYAGINVSSAKISSNRTQTMINLLSQHPEGIVIYDYGKPHAILLTDYTNGTFYCCDPSSAAPGGRIPISQATITIESVDKYWYVASPKLWISTRKPSVGNVCFEAKDGTMRYYCEVSVGEGVSTAAVNIRTDTGVSRDYTLPITNGIVSGYIDWNAFAWKGDPSNYTITVSVTDAIGNIASNSGSVDTKREITVIPNTEITLKVGETYQFVSSIKGVIQVNDEKWYVEGDGVTVSQNGLVTAIKPGKYIVNYEVGWTQNTVGTDIGGPVGISMCWRTVYVEPQTPQIKNLTADAKGNVNLSIEEATGADSYEIVAKKIVNGLEVKEIQSRIEAGKGTHVFSGLEDGSIWKYKIRACSTVKENTYYSDWSDEAMIQAMNLKTSILDADNGTFGEIRLKWKSVESAEGYLVYRHNGIDEKLLTITDKGNISYVDMTVEAGHTYSYRVIPYLGKEFGEIQNPVTVTAKEKASENGDANKDENKKEDTGKPPIVVKSGNVRLSRTSLTWNGKIQAPSVIARDSNGKIISSANYTVTCSNNKNVGQAWAVITFKNGYSGTIKKTFTIKPKGTNISKVSALKKGFTVKWKKQKSQITGYEIQYSTSSKFNGTKTIKNIKSKTTLKKVTKLKARKKYYVRIRTYKTVKINGKSTKIYSGWSKAKKVVTKK